MSTKPKWDVLIDAPIKEFWPILYKDKQILIISEHQLATFSRLEEKPGIFKYYSDVQVWIEWMKHPSGITTSYHTVSLNHTIKPPKLYIHNSEQQVIEIQIESTSANDQTEKKKFKVFDVGKEYDGSYSSSLIIDDKFHVFGGWNHSKHAIWNESTQSMDIQHELPGFNAGYGGHFVVHLKTQNRILLLGGIDTAALTPVDYIFEYDLSTNNGWKKLDAVLPIVLQQFGVIVSNDDKFLIIFGGGTENVTKTDEIWILRLDTMEFRKLDAVCPIKAKYHALLTVDKERAQILANGYIKWCWRFEGFEKMQYLIMDLVRMIGEFCCEEWVHLFERYRGHHWRIKLSDILY